MERDDQSLERFLERADAILSGAEPGDKGMRLGPYRLVRRIGHGAMGVVWLAEDETLDRRVALKVLAPHMTVDHEAIWRFGQEASAAARLLHPNIVGVHSAGEEGAIRYIAMDYVDGTGLDQMLARVRGRAPHEVTVRELGEAPADDSYLRRAVGWVLQAAHALHHAHSRGVLHRDIKPSNTLVDRNGEIRIVDFGLARIQEAAPVTRTGAILGTLTYMAPEALAGRPGNVDARADVYSLGTVLYELLALRPPFFSASLSELIDEVNRGAVPRLGQLHKGLPRDLELVVSKCLAKDREQRYATAQDLAQDLERFLAGEPVKARSPGVWTRLRYWAKRHPSRAAAAAAILVVAAAAWPVLRAASALAAAADAEDARTRAADALDSYRAAIEPLAEARAAYKKMQERLYWQSHDPERNAPLAEEQDRIERLALDQERRLEEARSALEDAARIEAAFGGVSDATQDAFAGYFLFRHERAHALGRDLEARLFREAVLRTDRSGVFARSLTGRASLTVNVSVTGADVYLFHYRDYRTVRTSPPVVPRLVPVPVGADQAGNDFLPGDTCLVVQEATPGSSLMPGDLVIGIDGRPCGEGAYVNSVAPGSLAARHGVRAWDRVHEIDRKRVRSVHDYGAINWSADHDVAIGARRFLVARGEELGIEVVSVEGLLGLPAPEGGVELLVLRGGRALELKTVPGQISAERAEVTAYPLLCSELNRIQPGRVNEIASGSYLLLVRANGHEEQRYPVVVEKNEPRLVDVELQRSGTTPPGFVWIPRGRTIVEGDPLQRAGIGRDPEKSVTADVDGFYIRRTEVTLGEWFEFINDPETLERIEAALRRGWTIYLPRHYDNQNVFARRENGGWVPTKPPDAPLFGVSAEDVKAFLEWHNAQAGARWRWTLPTPLQWERAARGADGRLFTWGSRYDPDLCHNQSSRRDVTLGYPARFEPRDESPFGVCDMIGSRREWTTGGLKGGSWGDGTPRFFRASFTDGLGDGYFNWTTGFRPVLEPR